MHSVISLLGDRNELKKGSQVGLDGQKQSRSGLCSKPPDLRSVGDIALNPLLRKSKHEYSQHFLRNSINPTCKLFVLMYTYHYIDNVRGERLQIATYNVRTLLKDEHVQELEDELKENNMKWDVIGLGEVRRKEESFTALQSGNLLYHSEANNGQAGVGFLINKKWKDNIARVSSGSSRVAELVLRITDRYQLKIVQVYAPTTSHSDEETDNFYITIDKILEKQTHYTIVMGDFNAKVGGQTERATGCFGLGQRNERGDTLVKWATSKNFKIMNTQFQKKAGRRWTWRSPDGNTKNEIDYIMTDKPSMVTDVTVINRVNIGSDHRMVMGSITLNTRAERRKLLNKNT